MPVFPPPPITCNIRNPAVDGRDDLGELLKRNRQRRPEDDHVAQGTQEDAVPQGHVADAAADLFRRGIRFPRGPIADQLDAGDQPALADMADVRVPGKGSEKLAQAGDFFRKMFQCPLFFKDVERGHGRRGPSGLPP